MVKRNIVRIFILGCMLTILVYFLLHKDFVVQEHLTQGPPTLLTLQNDTKELDTRMKILQKDFDNMSSQAKQGADAAASARAQISATKYSPSTTPP